MDSLAKRLKTARELAKLTQTQLSDSSGVKQSDISKLERGESLTTSGLVRLAKVLQVSPAWLDTGDGPMKLPPVQKAQLRTEQEQPSYLPAISDPSDLTIPQYSASGSMGLGLILEDQPPGMIKSWRVDPDWLRLNVPVHTGIHNLCIVTGFGPSMKPLYNPGDPLLMDRGVTKVETEGVFFFRVADHGYIKQLQRIPTEDGMILRAKSLNQSYDPFDITKKMDFQLFGKILTAWESKQV